MKNQTSFKKGHKTNVGRKRPDTRERMLGNKINQGRHSFRKGKKFWNENQKIEISKRQKGKHNSPNTEFKKGEERITGKNNNFWKGGITSINARIRSSAEYQLWRKAVFERDNYTCRFCGQVGGQLHADHIKSFSEYPELRFAIDNGRTLCVDCHRKTDNYAGRARCQK